MRKEMGELELAVMQAIWKLDEATVRDVMAAVGGDYAYTTIMTVMQRLYEKGSLKRRKEGRSFLYSTASQKQGLLERLKRTLFGGKSAELITYLIESSEDISKKDLAKIEELIREKKQ